MVFNFSDVKHRAAYVLGFLFCLALLVAVIFAVLFSSEPPLRKVLAFGGALYIAYAMYCATLALRLVGAAVVVGDAGFEVRRGSERRAYRWTDDLSLKHRAAVQMVTLLDRNGKEIFTIDYGFVSDRALTYILVEKIPNPEAPVDYAEIRARAKEDNRKETKRMILGAIAANIALRT